MTHYLALFKLKFGFRMSSRMTNVTENPMLHMATLFIHCRCLVATQYSIQIYVMCIKYAAARCWPQARCQLGTDC